MSPTDIPQLLWLVLLCSPPLVIALLLALWKHRPTQIGSIRVGNPLFQPKALIVPHEAVLRPMLYLCRTQSDADLRDLILGLRHMPLKDTAFILRRYLHSADPELQLYSQSILQEKQEQMQTRFTQLLARATPEQPAMIASCLEAGLQLVASPVTPEPERVSVLRKMFPTAHHVGSSGITHPRAVYAAARFYVLTRQVSHAEDLRRRLPEASPLWDALTALVRHHSATLHPPPPLTSGYTIQ